MNLREAVSKVIGNEAQAAVVRHSTWNGDEYHQSDTFAQVSRSGGGRVSIEAHVSHDAEHMEELGFQKVALQNGQSVWQRDANANAVGSVDSVASMLAYVSGLEGIDSNDFGGVRCI